MAKTKKRSDVAPLNESTNNTPHDISIQLNTETANFRNNLLSAVEGSVTPSDNQANIKDGLAGNTNGGNDNEASIIDESSSGGGILPFIELLFGKGLSYTSKKQAIEKLQVIQNARGFNKKHRRRLFAAMTDTLEKIMEEGVYITQANDENDDNYIAHTKSNLNTSQQSTQSLLYMRGCALAVETLIEGDIKKRSKSTNVSKEYEIEEEVFAVAELLHEVLFSLSTSCGKLGERVQSDICRMCESWWLGKFQFREALVPQLIPILLSKTLDYTDINEPKLVDVKRLYNMIDAMELFDFEEESITYLRSLMLRTMSSPLYLKSTEGKKIISYIFQLHETVVVDLHLAIKAQIPNAKKVLLQAYGEIYFQAWKTAFKASPVEENELNESNDEASQSEDQDSVQRNPVGILKCIEDNVLQDLMYSALHVAQPSLAKSLRTVLAVFHTSKKAPDIESLLYRLYGPILWRALKSANPSVKVNAAAILADTFPLRDPNLLPTQIQTQSQNCVERTVVALSNLLMDTHPKTRVAGADASVRILAAFWDAIPAEHIRSILNCIVMRHAYDSSSSAVRVSAISAIMILLDAPHTHAVLRALLPQLGNLIHDKVERVRLAAVKMLICVKKVKDIKFYHVVPVDHLLARLVAEGEHSHGQSGSPVITALTELLLNSYFPQGDNVTGSLQVQRTLSFLASDPIAASIFYSNVCTKLSVNSIAKLIAMIMKCLNAAIKANEDSKAESTRNHKGGTSLKASNTKLMASMTDTIIKLWETIKRDLRTEEFQSCREFLYDLGEIIQDAYLYFMDMLFSHREREEVDNVVSDCQRICASLLQCAGMFPEHHLEGMSGKIMSALEFKALERFENVIPQVALLCRWGYTEEIVQMISSSLIQYFKIESSQDDCKNAKMPVSVAIKLLSAILEGADSSCITVRESILRSNSCFENVSSALQTAFLNVANLLESKTVSYQWDEEDAIMMLFAYECYLRLLFHYSFGEEGRISMDPKIVALANWITTKVLPGVRQTNPLCDLDVSKISSPDVAQIKSPKPSVPADDCKNSHSRRLTLRFSSLSRPSVSFLLESRAPLLAYKKAISIGFIHLSCILFAELISITGNCPDEIISQASIWIQELHQQFADKNFGRVLLHAFGRLIIQSYNSTGDYRILQPFLRSACDIAKSDEDILNTIISRVLSVKNASYVENIVALVYEEAQLDISRLVDDEKSQCESQSLIKSSALCGALLAMKSNGAARKVLSKIVESKMLATKENVNQTEDFFNKELAQLLNAPYPNVSCSKGQQSETIDGCNQSKQDEMYANTSASETIFSQEEFS